MFFSCPSTSDLQTKNRAYRRSEPSTPTQPFSLGHLPSKDPLQTSFEVTFEEKRLTLLDINISF
jgi:hypothetical protein